MLYEFKLRVTRDTEKGEKEVTEQYITDCALFAEAEAKALEITNGKGDVFAINRSNVREIVNPNIKDKASFFRATIVDLFENDNGEMKEQKYNVLVAADTVAEATKLTQEYMKMGLEDMRLDGVVKTKILEIV